MAEGQQETREQEVARVRSYLASQSLRRTPQQLVEMLRDAHRQFLAAATAVPDSIFFTAPQEGAWAAVDVLAHVRVVAGLEEAGIRAVIERGEQPQPMADEMVRASRGATREELLAALEQAREGLIAAVLKADPNAHLDILWGHREFGQMHWREWLLFARVHALDHTRQMQAIAAALLGA